MKARIIRIVSKEYTLMDEHMHKYDAILSGKIRQLKKRPVTGDIVEADEIDGRYVIQDILPRRNQLIRPAVANVDQALIVMSVKDPDFSPALVDRLSVLIEASHIRPILVVTKCDLGISDDFEKRIEEYESGQMQVVRTAKGSLDPSLAGILAGKISVLTGQSGAGKSTLLNQLDPSFHLATQEISKALGRGKHTTRHNELHPVADGLVADTPGFSSLDFSHMDIHEVAGFVPDFQPYLTGCRFNDCIHQNEPDCAIKKAVEEGKIAKVRYENYLQILDLIQNRKVRYL